MIGGNHEVGVARGGSVGREVLVGLGRSVVGMLVGWSGKTRVGSGPLVEVGLGVLEGTGLLGVGFTEGGKICAVGCAGGDVG
jgi:hypothetical protein